MESQRKLYKYIFQRILTKKKKNVKVEFSTQCKNEDCSTEWNLSTSNDFQDFGLFVILTCFFFLLFPPHFFSPLCKSGAKSAPLSLICVVDYVNLLFEFVYCLVLQYTLITIFRLFQYSSVWSQDLCQVFARF